jgi:hypothetical protein
MYSRKLALLRHGQKVLDPPNSGEETDSFNVDAQWTFHNHGEEA